MHALAVFYALQGALALGVTVHHVRKLVFRQRVLRAAGWLV